MTSRRRCLNGIGHRSSTHPALWMERYFSVASGEKEAPSRALQLQKISAGTNLPSGYAEAMQLRARVMEDLGAFKYSLSARGRLAIWLKGGGAMETSTALQHTWGTPIVPARTLKGGAAAACEAAQEASWNPPHLRRSTQSAPAGNGTGRDFDYLFGTSQHAGCVVFHDAWWSPPANGGGIGLVPDVLTPHYNDYYLGGAAPTGMADPVPVPFPTVAGSFIGWLQGPEDWVRRALELIAFAASEQGFGAKGGSGYGYADVPEASYRSSALTAATDPTAELRASIAPQLGGLTLANCAMRVPILLSGFGDATTRQVAAELVLETLTRSTNVRSLPQGVRGALERALGRRLE